MFEFQYFQIVIVEAKLESSTLANLKDSSGAKKMCFSERSIHFWTLFDRELALSARGPTSG